MSTQSWGFVPAPSVECIRGAWGRLGQISARARGRAQLKRFLLPPARRIWEVRFLESRYTRRGTPVLQYFLSRNCLCPQTDIMFASWTESRRRRGFNPLNTKRNEAWTQTCIITLGLCVSAIFPSDQAKECHVPRCSLRAAATTKVATLHGNLQRGESGTAQPASLP